MVWLSDAQMQSLRVTLEEVKLEEIDETIAAVGPVTSADDCPVSANAKSGADDPSACVVVAIGQACVGERARRDERVRGDVETRSRTSSRGSVEWIAGALDPSGRSVSVACLFADRLRELRSGRMLRVEIVVGTRPAFAVSRGAIVRRHGDTFALSAAGTAPRTAGTGSSGQRVRTGADSGSPWLAVEDLPPGSFVVSHPESLAAMLANTSL